MFERLSDNQNIHRVMLKLLYIDWTYDIILVLDLQLIFYLRNKHPGASAIKFLSQLEIFILKLICWYDRDDIGNPKIFSEAEAYWVAIEEQKLRRYLFVKKINTISHLLFSWRYQYWESCKERNAELYITKSYI